MNRSYHNKQEKYGLVFYASTLLFCFHVLAGWAQNPEQNVLDLSLSQAIEYAQKHQSNTLNAQIDVETAKNTVKKTIGIGLPQLNGSLSLQDNVMIPTVFVPAQLMGGPAGQEVGVKFGTNYQSSVGLNLTQLLFDGSYLVGLQASKTYRDLSIRNLKRTRIETAIAVTKAYYAVLISNEQLNLIDANLKQLNKSLHDTQAMLANGLVEKIDVDRLLVLKNNSETERQNIVRLNDLSINLLKFQMGMPIHEKITLKDALTTFIADEPNNFQIQSDSTVYQNRIEYAILETNKKLNELDLKRYKSQHLPTASLSGNWAIFSSSANEIYQLYKINYPTLVFGLNINIPIFSGKQRHYSVQNAKLMTQKTQNDIQNFKNSISLEVAQAQTNYINGKNGLENQKRNLALAQSILEVTRVKYAQGVGSSLEVTTAETSLTETQTKYINALYEMLISKINLDKALGKINY